MPANLCIIWIRKAEQREHRGSKHAILNLPLPFSIFRCRQLRASRQGERKRGASWRTNPIHISTKITAFPGSYLGLVSPSFSLPLPVDHDGGRTRARIELEQKESKKELGVYG